MTFSLRQATPADLPDVVRLIRGLAEYEHFLHEFVATEDSFARLMFGPEANAEAVLADTPGRPPVGVALFYRTVNTFKGQFGLFLEDLFVEPAFRGMGIGKALLRHLAALAVERDYNVVEWRVLNWNENSIRFYENLGATRMTEWHVRRLLGPALIALAKGETARG